MDILGRRKEIHDEQSFRQWGVVKQSFILKKLKGKQQQRTNEYYAGRPNIQKCRQPSIDKRNEAYGLRHILLEQQNGKFLFRTTKTFKDHPKGKFIQTQ